MPTNYIVTDTDLTSIANAIRTKGGTSASLTYPSGFISAINNIPTGGSTDIEDGMITRAISGVYENSRVSTIGSYAFYYCTSLTTASFPNASYIYTYAFYSCTSLTTISFPVVKNVSAYAFRYCSSLTVANFPSALGISSFAFANCYKLTMASFPNATDIQSNAFASCSALANISFPSAKTIGSFAFANCYSLTTAEFPKVTHVYSNAFGYCSSLSTISLPAARILSSYALRSCHGLISLYLLGSSLVTLYPYAFSSTPIGGYSAVAGQFGSVYVPSSLYASYIVANNWSNISSRIVSVRM